MKLINKIFILFTLISTFSYAVTPFSLEGLKAVNVLVLNKDKKISKQLLKEIKDETIEQLQVAGIKTKTDEFSNFLIKIEVEEVGTKSVVTVKLILIESVSPVRDKKLENVAFTYQKNDFFIPDELEVEVYDSAVEFLVPNFIDQYIEEN